MKIYVTIFVISCLLIDRIHCGVEYWKGVFEEQISSLKNVFIDIEADVSIKLDKKSLISEFDGKVKQIRNSDLSEQEKTTAISRRKNLLKNILKVQKFSRKITLNFNDSDNYSLSDLFDYEGDDSDVRSIKKSTSDYYMDYGFYEESGIGKYGSARLEIEPKKTSELNNIKAIPQFYLLYLISAKYNLEIKEFDKGNHIDLYFSNNSLSSLNDKTSLNSQEIKRIADVLYVKLDKRKKLIREIITLNFGHTVSRLLADGYDDKLPVPRLVKMQNYNFEVPSGSSEWRVVKLVKDAKSGDYVIDFKKYPMRYLQIEFGGNTYVW